MTNVQMALLICVAPFVGLALLAALADWCAERWPMNAQELREWDEWYS